MLIPQVGELVRVDYGAAWRGPNDSARFVSFDPRDPSFWYVQMTGPHGYGLYKVAVKRGPIEDEDVVAWAEWPSWVKVGAILKHYVSKAVGRVTAVSDQAVTLELAEEDGFLTDQSLTLGRYADTPAWSASNEGWREHMIPPTLFRLRSKPYRSL